MSLVIHEIFRMTTEMCPAQRTNVVSHGLFCYASIKEKKKLVPHTLSRWSLLLTVLLSRLELTEKRFSCIDITIEVPFCV